MTTHRTVHRTLLSIVMSLCLLSAAAAQAGTPAKPADPYKERVIVFVHGLHGDRESWRASNGAYWPDMVKTDPHFAYSDVDVAEYPSPSSNGKMSSIQLSDMLWNRLRQDHVWDHHEVVFLAHSLGGILVEEMLLRHPKDAAKVRFIVSYGTPHQGSTVARVAAFYDKDPLLNDLSDADSNTFLTDLEGSWRGSNAINLIHRFCAYEGRDTTPDQGFARYFRPHTRVVGYYSATYGCDVTTPPVLIDEDHIHMIKPLNRNAAAYDFFRRVYRDNPILQSQVTLRDNVVAGLTATCNETNADLDLQVPVALDARLHERVLSATASLINTVDVRDIEPDPPVVTRVDANGVAHVHYGFKGPGKKLMVCLGTARASVQVRFSIEQQIPLREPAK